MVGKLLDSDVVVQPLLNPLQQVRKPGARCFADWCLDKLRLAALAMGRDDQPSGDFIGYQRAKVFTDDVQAKVDSSCAACGGEDVSFIDIKHIGLNLNGGKS